jgi:hypothetical protein
MSNENYKVVAHDLDVGSEEPVVLSLEIQVNR